MEDKIKIYDVFVVNIIKNSYCGTITANCGCTTGCGCFFVFIGDKEDARRKVSMDKTSN